MRTDNKVPCSQKQLTGSRVSFGHICEVKNNFGTLIITAVTQNRHILHGGNSVFENALSTQ